MDISGSLNMGAQLPISISQYIQQLLRRGPNFGPAMRAQSQQYAHPSLNMSPSGSWLDPMQTNQLDSRSYLGERGDVAQQNMTNKFSLVDLLTRSAGQQASLQNAIPFLEASNISGGMSGGSPLSMFGGGF